MAEFLEAYRRADPIVEYLYRGASVMRDDRIDWGLQDDADEQGTWANTDFDPTRCVLLLTHQTTGAMVTIDSDAAEYSLGKPGDGSDTFQWTAATATLVFAPGGLPIATFPAGTYVATLWLYDADRPNGIRWGRERIAVVVE